MNNAQAVEEPRSPARTRPVWLLDVDGVVNTTNPRWGSSPYSGRARAFGQEWKLRWAPALVDLIGTWHRQGRVEVRWATTWCPYADQLEDLWGLPRLQRTLSDQDASTREAATAAKLREALKVVEIEGRPLCWTDDDAIPDDHAIRSRLQPASARSLLISPSANRGLSREDLDRIDRFLTASTS